MQTHMSVRATEVDSLDLRENMMRDNSSLRRSDGIRRSSGEVQGHVIDEFVAQRLDRRDFLRRGALVGLSASALSVVIDACGGADSTARGATTAVAGKPGAQITVASIVPQSALNPVTITDVGGYRLLGQTGEYLCVSDPQLILRPSLATHWTPDGGSKTWTFHLQRGVTFHNGKSMTADDVVYTFKLNTDPKNSPSALTALAGILEPGGVHKVDNFTVRFELSSACGNFPYLVSSDNYNLIILPHGYDPTKWDSDFMGTGPFKLASYNTQQGASFEPYAHYWGKKALPSKTSFMFYQDQNSQDIALLGGSVDVLSQFDYTGGQAILNGSKVYNLRSSANRQMSLRCDTEPFTDSRVRRALALALDRSVILKGVYGGYATVGNDSPFAPVFPSTNPHVPQRRQQLAQARALLAQAGHSGGFSGTLTTANNLELPQLAQAIQNQLQKIGVKLKLNVETQTAYYGKATFGQSDWLDAPISLVNYGSRAVPNTFLTAAFMTHGKWNGARFSDHAFDTLARHYIGAVDLQSQQRYAGAMQRLLLAQTPVIVPIFENYLAATAKSVSGVEFTPIGHVFLANATKKV